MPKHFLHISDYSKEELIDILHLAKELKQKFRNREDYKPFKDCSLVMIFAKPSARTRVSFETGFEWMGGHALFLGPNDIGIGKREAIKDISRLFSQYNDMIMARLFDHEHILELAKYSSIPVINGLTDYNHPCQIMADIFTIWEHKERFEELKICYVGDGNNVVHSLIEAAVQFDFELCIACPKAYEPNNKILQWAKKKKENVSVIRDPIKAAKSADCIMTDKWISMGDKINKNKKKKALKPYQVNKKIMNVTKKDSIFMHCLPSNRGEEVTNEIVDGKQSAVWLEAFNRIHVQKSIIEWCLK